MSRNEFILVGFYGIIEKYILSKVHMYHVVL